MRVPESFVEHARLLCPFCGKEVRAGYVMDAPAGFHAKPICKPFRDCDDMIQFMMIVNLKWKSDSGSLEKN